LKVAENEKLLDLLDDALVASVSDEDSTVSTDDVAPGRATLSGAG
jgi:hypothetical protein